VFKWLKYVAVRVLMRASNGRWPTPGPDRVKGTYRIPSLNG